MRSGSKARNNDKVVHLSSVEGEGSLKGKCGNCRNVCVFKAKEYKKHKGNLHSCFMDGDSGGSTNNGGSSNMCNFCGLKEHKKQDASRNFLRRHWHGTKKRM